MMTTLNSHKNWTNVNGTNFNDMASSASHGWYGSRSDSYEHKDWGGRRHCINYGVSRPHLSSYSFNDIISSNKVVTGSC